MYLKVERTKLFWYLVSKIVPTNCKKKKLLVIEDFFLKFEAEGREFAKILRSLEQFIYLTERSYQFFEIYCNN